MKCKKGNSFPATAPRQECESTIIRFVDLGAIHSWIFHFRLCPPLPCTHWKGGWGHCYWSGDIGLPVIREESLTCEESFPNVKNPCEMWRISDLWRILSKCEEYLTCEKTLPNVKNPYEMWRVSGICEESLTCEEFLPYVKNLSDVWRNPAIIPESLWCLRCTRLRLVACSHFVGWITLTYK